MHHCVGISALSLLVLQFEASAPPDPQLFSLQVCLVGKSRSYLLRDEAEAERRRAHYILSRQQTTPAQRSDAGNHGRCCHGNPDDDRTPGSGWGAGFQPRDKVEVVRNCAALPRDFVDGVVQQVADALLGMTAGGGEEESAGDWNRGGKPQHSDSHRAPQIQTNKSQKAPWTQASLLE